MNTETFTPSRAAANLARRLYDAAHKAEIVAEERGKIVVAFDDQRRGIILRKRHTYVRCCGEWMLTDAFTTTCPHCGADYNWNGHRLAPRSQWGEETGEHWSECY